MLNIIKSTKTITRDDHEVSVSTYTLAGYTLVRVWSPVESRTEWRVNAPHDLPSITETSAFMAKTPTYGVNWSAQGTQGTADARAYGALLMTAADVADVFNRIVAEGN